MKRDYRFIEKGSGGDSLSDHEAEELRGDFDIDTKGFYVVTVLTKAEWDNLIMAPAPGS